MSDHAKRKGQPLARGLLDYFPNALLAVAECSRIANDQHNPGEPVHWARGKSTDHADCILRHMIDRGTVDSDGVRHSAKVAWRALALLEEELEAAGARSGRASVFAVESAPVAATRWRIMRWSAGCGGEWVRSNDFPDSFSTREAAWAARNAAPRTEIEYDVVQVDE
jgi:hypothetical protein